MLDLSPAKLLIVFIVVVVLLGPNRLPEVARQLGAGWRRLRDLQQRMEHEVRKSVPDLPSGQDLVRFARSPVTLLNELAAMPSGDRDAPVVDPAAPPPGAAMDGPGVLDAVARPPAPLQPSDDPGMN